MATLGLLLRRLPVYAQPAAASEDDSVRPFHEQSDCYDQRAGAAGEDFDWVKRIKCGLHDALSCVDLLPAKDDERSATETDESRIGKKVARLRFAESLPVFQLRHEVGCVRWRAK